MFLAGMNQLAVAGTEIVKSLVGDNQTKKSEENSSNQINYIDSVTLSDEAVELSSKTGTDMDFKDENSGADQRQELPSTVDTLINILAWTVLIGCDEKSIT